MAVGLGRSRADIDYRAGQLATALRNTFDEIDRFQAFLAGFPDADLEAAPIGYTTTDVAQLKSAFTDLAQLGAVYRGTATRTPAYDYRTFAKLLTGVQ